MISYQLYSSRNFGPMADTLRMVADIGYDAVEGYGALYADADKVAETAAALAETGLKMPSGHFGLEQLEQDAEGVLSIVRALGINKVFCPFLMPDDRPTDAAGWAAFGARLATASKPFLDAGLAFGWHNHDFEFRALPDGTFPIDAILTGNDLSFEFDVAWAFVAGFDPAAAIDRYGPRIAAAHVKDRAREDENANEDGWADLGRGIIDWGRMMRALRGAGCDLFVMEHDNPSDDARFARASLAHLQTL